MIFAGLGNPGINYEKTRHNVGFMVMDKIAYHHNLSFKHLSKFKSDISFSNYNGSKDILLKPQTFMNLSGSALVLVKNYYKEDLDDIIVFHDDIDLKLGQIKYKQGGGHAGHNGLRSLDECIGKNYHRVRIGIGRPNQNQEVASFVLKNFTSEELDIIEPIIDKIVSSYSQLIAKNFQSIL